MVTFADTGLALVEPVTPESITPSVITESVTKKRKAITFGGQCFALTVEIEPVGINYGVASGIVSAHIARHGVHRSFATEMPQPLGTLSERVDTRYAVSTSPDVGSETVVLSITDDPSDMNDQAALSGQALTDARKRLSIGRYITIGSDKKIYQITKLASNSATITVYPAFRTAVSGEVNLTPNIQVFYTEESIRGLTYNQGLAIPTLGLIEAT